MKRKLLLAALCLGLSDATLAVQIVMQDGAILVADDDATIPDNLNFSACGTIIGMQNVVNVVDVSACNRVTRSNACIGIVDLTAGTANLPCVTLRDGDGTEYKVNMDQRGDSMNWKVTFVDFNYRQAH